MNWQAMTQIQLVDGLRHPSQGSFGPVLYQQAGNRTWYRVFVFITGHDVSLVHHVRYYFPPDFSQPVVDVPRTHGNFWFATEITTAFVGFDVGADVWLRHTNIPSGCCTRWPTKQTLNFSSVPS